MIKAQEHLDELLAINIEDELPLDIKMIIHYSKALVLKMGSRMIDKAKAQEILQKLVTEDTTLFDLRYHVILDLVELLLHEFKTYGETVVQEQIISLIDQLNETADKSNSIDLLIKAMIIKSKFLLVDGQIKEAEDLLEKAKTKSKATDSISIKNWVNFEIETLHREFEKLINLIDQNKPVKERIENLQLVEYISKATRYFQKIG